MAKPSKKRASPSERDPIPDSLDSGDSEESDDLEPILDSELESESHPYASDARVPALPAGTDGASSKAVAPVTTLQQYLAEVRRYPYLSKEEELQLFHEYHTHGSREAAVQLILANLRVSVAIAYEYLHTGADHMDLIQEGNVGLMQAIKKFDPKRNVRFHAYAAWWARAYILRYLLNNYRLVKVGTTQDQRRLFYNLRKEKARLEREGFAPDTKLLADRLNVRERDVIEMDQRLGSWELSLDQPLSTEAEGTLLDILPSQEQAVDEQLGDSQLRELFREKLGVFIQTVGEREEDILRNRILSETPVTLEDLGRKYGITKERTRQLEARIISRLRDYLKKEVKDFDQLRH
jgi:RNA polymerase sigma-32 factor